MQRTATAAILSILAAIASFFATFTGHPIWGLVLGLASLPLGVVGLVTAASPRVSGGLLSIAGMILGIIALGLSVLGMIGAIIF